MKNILAAVDFSDVTRDVIDAATKLADGFGARLYLLHVAPPDPDFVGYDPGPEYIRTHAANQLRQEHAAIQDLKQSTGLDDEHITALLIQGTAPEKILQEQSRLAADLVIMGSHGHGALHRLLVGSVAEAVLRRASCPVLIIPARKD